MRADGNVGGLRDMVRCAWVRIEGDDEEVTVGIWIVLPGLGMCYAPCLIDRCGERCEKMGFLGSARWDDWVLPPWTRKFGVVREGCVQSFN